jgi:hypothetical protein
LIPGGDNFFRDPHVIPIRCYPVVGAVRADPRYGALLAKLNLAEGATGSR